MFLIVAIFPTLNGLILIQIHENKIANNVQFVNS